MGFNLTYSMLSLQLIVNSPLFTPSLKFNQNAFSFDNIFCQKFAHHYLYTTSNFPIKFHKSTFNQFFPYNPILIDSKGSKFSLQNRPPKSIQSKLWDWDTYNASTYNSTQIINTELTISVLFDSCVFKKCHNMYASGGAIRFMKNSGCLRVSKCQFTQCTSLYECAAIYVKKYANGDYLPATVELEDTTVEQCYDSHQSSNYVANAIEVYLSKINNAGGFKMTRSQFVDCKTPVRNKIVQAQIRLFSNTFHMQYNNFTDKTDKTDFTAVLFSKFVQATSVFSFTTLFNQYGNTNFEFYDVESGAIHFYRVNAINTTFTSYAQDELISKIAVFNILTALPNSFYIDEFFCIDYQLLAIGASRKVNPVFIILHTNSQNPLVYNCHSNINLDGFSNKYIEYMESLTYDYNHHDILSYPPRKDNTPAYTDEYLTPTITENITEEKREANNKTEFNVIAVIVGFALFGVVGIIIIIIEIRRNKINKSMNESTDSDDHQRNDALPYDTDLFYGSKKKTSENRTEEIQMVENLI